MQLGPGPNSTVGAQRPISDSEATNQSVDGTILYSPPLEVNVEQLAVAFDE